MESMTDTTAHPTSRRYPPEIKERAVRTVVETNERTVEQDAVSRVTRQLATASPFAPTGKQYRE